MAYAVLHSLAQAIDQFLNHNEYPISVDGKQQLASTREQVLILQKFIVEFPQEARSLEIRIRDAANDVEDVLEHFMYEHIPSHHKSVRLAEVGRPKPADIDYDLGELEMVMDELNSIAAEAEVIKPKNAAVRRPPATPSAPMPPPTVDTFMVGIVEDLQKIKDSVCEELPERKIIPITGMGGIGKTTLARKIYDDPLVMAMFPVRAWITVSHDHKPENIFEELLFNLPNVVKEGHADSTDSTEDKLYKILTLRKYLIVVDDLWSEKAWDDIWWAFGDAGSLKGSRIVITTRNENVAYNVSPGSPCHEMWLLSPDESRSLLEKKVFTNGQCPPELKKVVKDIKKSCMVLPLAIVVAARILSTISETQSSWEEVAKIVSSLIQEDAQFHKRMSLSYTHLPVHLRPCFLYMGSFPENHLIRVSKLIKLWIAEGLVEHEEKAERYLSNIMSRSLALVADIKSNGKVKGCFVHNMMLHTCAKERL